MKKIAVIDFDGTICEHRYPLIGEPKAGVKKALTAIQAKGYEIHILSCRTNPELVPNIIDRGIHVREMKAYLNKHEIPFDIILNEYKPVADVYIDDKARRFEDNWSEIVDKL